MASLKSETVKAFEEYVGEFEKTIDAMVSGKLPFLWINNQGPDLGKRARAGETLIFKSHENIGIHKGIIHIWGVSAFIPGAKAEDATTLLLDYDRHRNMYPSVIDSKVLEKDGDTVKGYLKFKYKKVITVVLNTEHQSRLARLGQGRYYIRAFSTRIAEVADFGKPNERELPVGEDSGFLWRLNSYWMLEQQADGVFIECQSLTLTRSIPFGLSWLIRTFIDGVPRDSLEELVQGTRSAFQ